MPRSTWQTLTKAELAAEPEARLGGAIAVIFALAILVLLPWLLASVKSFVSWFTDPPGAPNALQVLGGMLSGAFGSDIQAASLAYATMQTLALAAWAILFVIATLFRLRAVATLAAVVFAICMLLSPIAQILLTTSAARENTFFILASLSPRVVVGLVAGVAYWAYMRDGHRPNLYFARRVRI